MSASHDPDAMANLTSTYVKVLVLEVVIVALLWALGRLFS
jgi:hypothetical protein